MKPLTPSYLLPPNTLPLNNVVGGSGSPSSLPSLAAQNALQRSPAHSEQAYTDLNSLQKLKSEANKDVALRKVAKQFESLFVSLLFKGMRQANAVFEEGNFGHSNAEKMYRDMYDQQMSLNLAEGRGLGVADMVYKQLKGQSHRVSSAEVLDHDRLNQRISSPVSALIDLDKLNHNQLKDDQLKNGQLEKNDTVHGDKIDNDVSLPSQASNKISSELNVSLNTESPGAFVQSLYPIVKNVAFKIGLDPLMMIAQAALETGWGKHLVKDSQGKSSNNLFNIKADSRWGGPRVTTQTVEYRDGIAIKEVAKFRRYDSIVTSAKDFIDFIQNNPRYQGALEKTADSQKFIEELQRAGYATDPNYAKKIQSVYERVNAELTMKTEGKSVNQYAPSITAERSAVEG